MACPSGGSCCSLQARLHQLEAARAREMEAHGLSMRELQREADASSASVKELQLELAKMRAAKCRLEAEVASACRRVQRALETLDAERDTAAKVLLEKEAMRQEKERTSTRVQEELSVSQRERERLVEERIELRMAVDALRLENKSLHATGEERLQTIHLQAAENGRLLAVCSTHEQEIATLKLRYELKEKELASTHAILAEQREQLSSVERALEKALQTRNRVITWRRGWIDTLRCELARRELFVAWKIMFADAAHSRNTKAAATNDATRVKLHGIRSILRDQCAAVRDDFKCGKAMWQQQRAELEALHRQAVTDAFPKMMALAVRVRDRCEMTTSDAYSKCVAVREAYKIKKQHARDREGALVKLLESRRSATLRGRVFNRWKDWYLRNVVGQTTHAALVARGIQPAHFVNAPTSTEVQGYDHRVSQTCTPESTTDTSLSSISSSVGEVKVAPREVTRRNLADVSAAVMASRANTDESWQRWRRVASAGNAPRKSKVMLQSPLASPSRDIRDTQMKRAERPAASDAEGNAFSANVSKATPHSRPLAAIERGSNFVDSKYVSSQTAMERTAEASKSASSGSLHAPLFDSPSKRGVHHTPATYTPTERRFKWQEPSSNSTDALYKLPSCIGAGSRKSFGTSTREDWDPTRKRGNPCAGPGSYESPSSCGRQSSSQLRSAAFAAFENASRAALRSDMTPSPGPVYDLPIATGSAPSPKIGTSTRPPLNGKVEGPGPNLALPGSFRECRPLVSPTFGTEKRLRPGITAGHATPGAVYDVTATGFRTGPSSSFSHAKRF